MKAFNFKEDFGNCVHVNDCKVIWEYLTDIGSVNIPQRELSEYFTKFSNLVYSVKWVEVDSNTLETFAEWLSYVEV